MQILEEEDCKTLCNVFLLKISIRRSAYHLNGFERKSHSFAGLEFPAKIQNGCSDVYAARSIRLQINRIFAIASDAGGIRTRGLE